MQKSIKINSGRTLSQIIDAVVNESLKSHLYVNAVDEKRKQRNLTNEDEDLSLDNSANDKSSKTAEDEMEKLKKAEITSEDIVEKLNAIRAGKSFKDNDISSRLDEYISSLKKAEKVALLAFLKGISQIVTGEVTPEDAVEPSDDIPGVSMKKGEEIQKKTIKPTVIKKPDTVEKKQKSSTEDTSGPVPITPKK